MKPVTTDIQNIITISILRLNFTINHLPKDELTKLKYNKNLRNQLLKE